MPMMHKTLSITAFCDPAVLKITSPPTPAWCLILLTPFFVSGSLCQTMLVSYLSSRVTLFSTVGWLLWTPRWTDPMAIGVSNDGQPGLKRVPGVPPYKASQLIFCCMKYLLCKSLPFYAAWMSSHHLCVCVYDYVDFNMFESLWLLLNPQKKWACN